MPALFKMCAADAADSDGESVSSEEDESSDDSHECGGHDIYDAHSDPDGCYALICLAEDAVCALHRAAPDVTYHAMRLANSRSFRGNRVSNSNDANLLFWACEAGCAKIAEWLVQRPEMDLEAQDTDGGTPLLHACAFQRNRAIQVLVRAGANPCVRNIYGAHPFKSRRCASALHAAMTALRQDKVMLVDAVAALRLFPHGLLEIVVHYTLPAPRSAPELSAWAAQAKCSEKATRSAARKLQRTRSGWNLFAQDQRALFQASARQRRIQMRMLTERWKALDTETRREYMAKSNAEKARFRQQVTERQCRARALSRFD